MTADHRDLDDVLDEGLSTFFKILSHERSGGAGVGAADDERGQRRADPVLPSVLGRLVLGDVIGRGGMGLVLRAHDPELDRDVAVKVLQDPFGRDPELVERFVSEAVVSSRLQHPGIVPIYDIGRTDDGRPYYSMKIVDGETLKDAIEARRHPQDGRSRFLEVFARVCETVAFGHARGVVHGDLKPSNVMVGSFGEVQVMDWGFARALGDSLADRVDAGGDDEPAALHVLGTPAYMAPEQARGESEAVDERTDVFGLGGILCEILTGAPVYLGETRSEILLRASKGWIDDAVRRLQACESDRTLVELVEACLAPERERRPRDAGEVLRRVAEHLATVEERARAMEIAAAEARVAAGQERRARRLTLAASVAVVIALASLGGGYLWVQREHSERAAENARIVTVAMERGQVLLEEARRAAVGELATWRDALAAARQADSVASSVADDPALVLQSRALVECIEAEYAAALADETMRRELEEIRLSTEQDRVPAALDAAYRTAFADYGADIDAVGVAAAVDSMRSARIREDLIRGLDDWGRWRSRVAGVDGDAWRRLLEIAGHLDEHPFRQDLRLSIANSDTASLRTFAGSPGELREAPVSALDLLGTALIDMAEFELAVSVYRLARELTPEDFWVNHELASLLQHVAGRPDAETIALSWTCVSLRPASAHAWTDLGMRLLQMPNSREGGVAALRRAIEVDASYARAWVFLGSQRCAEGDTESGVAALRNAAALAGDDVKVVLGVGVGLEYDALRPAEAVAHYRRGVELRPDDPETHLALGGCCLRLGLREEAVSAGRRAVVAAGGEDALPRSFLGLALIASGEFEEAMSVLNQGGDPRLAVAAEQLRVHGTELVAVRNGAEPPTDPGERVGVARAALYQGRAQAAYELFASAFEAAPRLAGKRSGRRLVALDAARAAAAVGAASDALTWLRRAVSEVKSRWGSRELREIEMRNVLVEIYARPEFDPYRTVAARDGMASAERVAWDALWTELRVFYYGQSRR